MRKTGHCHCKAVKFTIPFDGDFKKIRGCNCSMCARRGAVVASVKVEDLIIESGQDKLSLYQFGTFTAKHYFCSVCGIYTFHQRRSEPSEYAINIACFDDVKIEEYKDAPYIDGRDNHPKDRIS
jgi:hypothetical protein